MSLLRLSIIIVTYITNIEEQKATISVENDTRDGCSQGISLNRVLIFVHLGTFQLPKVNCESRYCEIHATPRRALEI